MAYDENGNWYFDPNDLDDQHAFAEEAQREKMRDIVKQQKKIAKDQQDLGNLWNEALSEEGIDAQTYEQLYQADPELAKDLMREGMKHLAKGIKRGRDAKGRFTKQAPAEIIPGGQQRSQEAQQRIDAVKQKAEAGNLSEQDELDLIDGMIGDLF